MNCGIMDQFAVAMGKEDNAIFFDTQIRLNMHRFIWTVPRLSLPIPTRSINWRIPSTRKTQRMWRSTAEMQKEVKIRGPWRSFLSELWSTRVMPLIWSWPQTEGKACGIWESAYHWSGRAKAEISDISRTSDELSHVYLRRIMMYYIELDTLGASFIYLREWIKSIIRKWNEVT